MGELPPGCPWRVRTKSTFRNSLGTDFGELARLDYSARGVATVGEVTIAPVAPTRVRSTRAFLF